MVSAPVGFQCVECVGQNQAPKVKASFGASRNQIPVVSKYLIGICVGALFYTLLNGGVSYMALQFGMVPEAIANGQWWRLVSAAFLHGGILHLAFNMYALYWLGPQLEQLLGHVRFASIYMLSAIGGNVVSYYFSDIATVSVGASGAIFGLMTATIVIGRELRADVSQLMTLLVLNVVIGFASAGIDWRAHLGGAIVGAATGYLQTHSGKNLRFSGMTAIVVILLALVFVRNQQVLNALMGQ
jgi:membrane associated rhomboid family serine protease